MATEFSARCGLFPDEVSLLRTPLQLSARAIRAPGAASGATNRASPSQPQKRDANPAISATVPLSRRNVPRCRVNSDLSTGNPQGRSMVYSQEIFMLQCFAVARRASLWEPLLTAPGRKATGGARRPLGSRSGTVTGLRNRAGPQGLRAAGQRLRLLGAAVRGW